jgi:hypothetical protein
MLRRLSLIGALWLALLSLAQAAQIPAGAHFVVRPPVPVALTIPVAFTFERPLSPAVKAYWHGTPPPACPYTAFSSSDGCSGAPGYINSTLSFQDQHAFSDGTLFQNGQMPTGAGFTAGRNNNVNWNVACVDYACGVTPGIYCNSTTIPCSQTPGAINLIDAIRYFSTTINSATGDSANTGCAAHNTGSSYTAGAIICKTGSSTINFIGFDLSPTVAGVQTCTPVQITSSGSSFTSGTMNFKNNRYLQTNNNSACLAPAGGAAARIGVSITQNWSQNVLNNFMDMQSKAPFMLNVDVVAVQTQGIGTADIERNYFGNSPTKTISTQNCQTIVNYNGFHNNGFEYGHALHTEFFILGGIASPSGVPCSAANQTIVGNLAWQDTTLGAPPTALLFDAQLAAGFPDPSGGNYPALLAGDYELNVLVTNPTTDGAGSLSWYTFLSGGSTYTLTTPGSGYVSGDIVQINVAGCRIPPQYQVSPTLTALVWRNGSCLGAAPPSTTTIWQTTDLTTPTASGATLAIPGWINSTTSSGIAFAGSGGGNSYQNLTIANNAMDLSGILGCQTNAPGCAAALAGHAGDLIYCANPATFANNFNLLNNTVLPPPTPRSGC